MAQGFRPIRDDEIDTVIALWDRAGMTRPWNPPRADIEAIRANPKSALLVACADGVPVASVVVEDGGHRAWVYYLCADPARRGEGWGGRAMAAAEHLARAHQAAACRPPLDRARPGFLRAPRVRGERGGRPAEMARPRARARVPREPRCPLTHPA